MCSAYFGKLYIGSAGYLSCKRCIEWLEIGARSADAEDCGGDVCGFHHGDVLFWCPFLGVVNWRSPRREEVHVS